MSTAARPWFWCAFLVVALAVAGGLSQLSSSSPDALESATLRGCEVAVTGGVERLTGECIARSATGHAMAGSPLADYSLAGGSGGLAGVIGTLLTLAVAGAVCWAVARTGSRRDARRRRRA